MVKYISFGITIALFSFCSCINDKVLKTEIQENPTVIKVESSTNNKISFQNIIDDIVFIVLENNKNSFISQITRIFEIENKLYIFDDTLNKISFFSINGEFLGNIGKLGSGPGEFKDLSDIAVDYQNKEILALAIDKNSILRFDLNGNYLGYSRVEFPIFKFCNYNSNYTGYFIGYYGEDFYNFKITNNKDKIVFKDFKFPNDNNEDLMKYAFTGYITTNNNGFLYSDATSSKIYEIIPEQNKLLKYKFKFEKNPWDEEKIFEHETFFKKIQLGQLSFLRSQYEENDNALMFSYNHSITDNPKVRTNYPKNGFFLTNSKMTYTHYNLEGDLIYDNLSAPKGKSQDNRYFYATLNPLNISNEELNKINYSINIGNKIIGLDQLKNIDTESTLIVKFKVK